MESLNARQKEASKHYAFVTPPKALLTEDRFFGGDAIMVAMIYRPALLTPERGCRRHPLPQQRYTTGGVTKSAGQRDSLVQRFTVAGSDAP